MNEVEETIKAASVYLNRLESLKQKVQKAQEQIHVTSKQTKDEIEVTFNNLIEKLCEILSKRRDNLIKKVFHIREESLRPLNACHTVINEKINVTSKLISQGHSLLNGVYVEEDEFSKSSSKLGSLPEIPELKQVPYVSFHFDKDSITELKGLCSRFGDVYKIAPVQISKLNEKPGGILVEWQSVMDDDDERINEIQEYRIQRVFGDVTKLPHLAEGFSDSYQGSETQYLIKDLRANQLYSFRVCCKFEGSSEWSPWSLPQVAQTTIPSFSWENNKDYTLSNENRIAKALKESPSILISDGPQFGVGNSVEFTMLEVGTSIEIGLVSSLPKTNDLKDSSNHFIVNNNGEIYVDGTKKSTVLPRFTNGTKISFTCELINEERIRINVDSCDKRVTYEWHIEKSQKLYFGAKFASNNSKIMVE